MGRRTGAKQSEFNMITIEWLEQNGFSRDRFFGFIRELSTGPEEITLCIAVGTYPFNVPCVSLVVGGFGIVTKAGTPEDVLTLIRLMDGAPLDHPYSAEIEASDEEPE